MEASIGVNLRVTAHSHQGGRKYMEDMFCVAYQPTADDRDLLYAYFGIFDGHGGREAALYAKQHLMDFIVSQKNFWSDDDELVLKAIKDGFISTHYAMWKDLETWPKTPSGLPSTSGTTASIAFVRRGKLYIGHVGDSGIVMGYEDPETGFWRAKPLTKDHKPESPLENARISEAGGKVIVKSGVPRVVWNRPRIGHKGPVRRSTMIDEIPFLAVARSLGDLWSYNSEQNEFVVSPCPDVSVLEIDVHSHRCLILGTDGLWNMLSPQDAVNSVYFAEKNNERQPQHLLGPNDPLSKTWINPSKRLVDRALDRWQQHNLRADNTSVVTVVVDPPGPPKVKRSHVIRHSFSSTQDPTSSPVGMSRYFPQNHPHPVSCNYGPGCPSRENLRHREAIDPIEPTVQTPASIAVPAPKVSQNHNRLQVPVKPSTSVSQSVAPILSASHYTRAQRRGLTRRGVIPSSTQPDPLLASDVNATPDQAGRSSSAFYPVSSQIRRHISRTDISNGGAVQNSTKSSDSHTDDVQIHEISSSSETDKVVDASTSNHVVLRKRKAPKFEIPAERKLRLEAEKRRRIEERRLIRHRPSTRTTTANSSSVRKKNNLNSRGSFENSATFPANTLPHQSTTDVDQSVGAKKCNSRPVVAVLARDKNIMGMSQLLGVKKGPSRFKSSNLAVTVPVIENLAQVTGSKKNTNRSTVTLTVPPKSVTEMSQRDPNRPASETQKQNLAAVPEVKPRTRRSPTRSTVFNSNKKRKRVSDAAKAAESHKNAGDPVSVTTAEDSCSTDKSSITKNSNEISVVDSCPEIACDLTVPDSQAARAKKVVKKMQLSHPNLKARLEEAKASRLRASSRLKTKQTGSPRSKKRKSPLRSKKVLKGRVNKKSVNLETFSVMMTSATTAAAERSLRSTSKSALRVTRSMK